MSIDRLIWAKENPAACPAPFSGVSLRAHYVDRPDVRYSCCCNLEIKDIIPGQQQVFFQQLRDSMQAGQIHPACKICHSDESRGAISERIRYWLDYSEKDFSQFLERWNSDVFEIKVKFSNLCPMACRSCDSAESSTYAQIVKDNSVFNHIRQDFTLDPENWQAVKESVQQVADQYARPVLHLIGGEPLVQQGCERLMAWMKEQGLCSRFELRLTTSWAVNLSSEFLELMKSFRYVTFLLSIDSVGTNYHYVRWPVKFEKVEKNLATLINIMPSLNAARVHLIPVFSLNNVFYLSDYLDYFYQWQQQNNIGVVLSNQHLFSPQYLQLEILPGPYRQRLADALSVCIEHPMVKQGQSVLQASLKSTIDQLRRAPGDEQQFLAYLRYTAEFDVRTRTRFEEYNTRLYHLLSDEHRAIYLDQLGRANSNLPINQSLQRF